VQELVVGLVVRVLMALIDYQAVLQVQVVVVVVLGFP
jgi:hypothetical protein